MRRAALHTTFLLVLGLAVAPEAGAQGFDGRVGGFLPRMRDCGVPSSVRAEYTLFQDDCELYAIDKNAFNGVYGGVEYNQVVMKNVELAVHYDYASKTVDTFYRNYERPDNGGNIYQSLRLRMAPLGISVRLVPTSKRARIAPFVGGGVDAIFYRYEEYGDFIDFFDPDLTIYADHFIDDGVAFGAHAFGGLRVYLNRDFAIVGEGRYQWSGKDMGDDFLPNEPGFVNRIDLTGWTWTVGVHVRF